MGFVDLAQAMKEVIGFEAAPVGLCQKPPFLEGCLHIAVIQIEALRQQRALHHVRLFLDQSQ
jgi:hypothetical protein